MRQFNTVFPLQNSNMPYREHLFKELYTMLTEINRICDKYGIKYFAMGGSAIGAIYDKGILPWDDDIDIGMVREDYNKFLEIAPNELNEDYFLSWYGSDQHTPFFYAKLKKNNTIFIEEQYKNVPMHQGIFIDIFPYDKANQNKHMQQIQFKCAEFIKCCLMSKEVWLWKHCGRCQIEKPWKRNWFSCCATRIVNTILSKKQLYDLIVFIQSYYNSGKHNSYKLINTFVDYISKEQIDSITYHTFGTTQIMGPADMAEYMKGFRRFTNEEALSRGGHSPYLIEL